ncbi:hypothetical protein [Ornithinimicrobium kibberense]|uniref:hypothetical protein n=1 Tax=Ornithinimicrobium kibberense TaxID=282060 RepID=UPI003613D720
MPTVCLLKQGRAAEPVAQRRHDHQQAQCGGGQQPPSGQVQRAGPPQRQASGDEQAQCRRPGRGPGGQCLSCQPGDSDEDSNRRTRQYAPHEGRRPRHFGTYQRRGRDRTEDGRHEQEQQQRGPERAAKTHPARLRPASYQVDLERAQGDRATGPTDGQSGDQQQSGAGHHEGRKLLVADERDERRAAQRDHYGVQGGTGQDSQQQDGDVDPVEHASATVHAATVRCRVWSLSSELTRGS